MKKLIFLIFPVFLMGCTHDMNRREIDEINFIHVLGIDYSNQEYKVSALYGTGDGADPEEGAKEELSSGTGKTPYAALEDLIKKNKKSITLAQAGFFLLGHGAAEEGLNPCLDFLSRDETIKMEALVYVTQNQEASEFIQRAIDNKQTVLEDLESIRQKQLMFLTRLDNSFVNILNEMEQTNSSVLIPYLISEEEGFKIQGYTVFDELKLKDYLDTETSDGINFIKNIVRNYPIYVEDFASLSITYCDTDLSSVLEEKKLVVNIEVSFDTMLREVNTDENLFSMEGIDRITREQNNYIKTILEKPINYSIATGLDILQLARLVEKQNIKGWQELEKEWKDNISEIEYQLTFHSKVIKSFILGNEG